MIRAALYIRVSTIYFSYKIWYNKEKKESNYAEKNNLQYSKRRTLQTLYN